MAINNLKEKGMQLVFLLAACASILAVALICVFMFGNGIPAMREIGVVKFLTGTLWEPFADIYGNTVTIDRAENEPAKNSQKAQETLKAQLCKLGDTIFSVDSYMANLTEIPFIPISELNDIRRNACERLLEKRMQTHKVPEKALSKTTYLD